MRDEHLIYKNLPDGKLRILPEAGYRLFCTLTKAYLSEAIAKPREVRGFVSEKEAIREIYPDSNEG